MKEKDLIERMDRMEKAILAGLQMMENLTNGIVLPGGRDSFTQAEVVEMTGWSNASISRWVKEGVIETVPSRGKRVRIMASEVKRFISLKGQGRKARRSL